MFIFDIKVLPGSNRMRWEVHHSADILTCYHKNPDDSKAVNTDIINALAQALGINHSKVHLVQGVETRDKRFKIGDGHGTYQDLLQKLGLSKKA